MSIQRELSAPPADDRPLSADELAEARQYGRRQLACSLLDRGLDLAYLATAAFVWGVPLDRALAAPVPGPTPRLALMYLLVLAGHLAVSFPLSWYSGHALEQRYGLSRQTFGRWLARYAKRSALAIGFGLALFVGLYQVIWLFGAWWWIAAAAGFFVVSVLVAQLAPVLILPLFHKIEPLESPELAERMQQLAAGTGLTIQGVYRMRLSDETAKANAMLAGLGRTRRVLMGDTLLDRFSPEEIAVIFAHELGHHVHRHIRKLILAGIAWSAVGFWLCDRLLLAWARHVDGAAEYATLPVYTLPLAMWALTLFSVVLEPLQNAVSRRYERQCDRYALARTGLRAAYVTAFQKLARLNKDDPDPHPWEVLLFHSHPPISERLALADAAAD